MSNKPKILALSGSARKDSCNKKLIRIAAKEAEAAGADITLVDLADYPIPLYNGDLEEKEGIPKNAKTLKQMFIDHEGFLISSPEYNSSVSGVLKNYIDWISRPEESDSVYLCAFKGKKAALMSASPGNLGGLRGLYHLRWILENVGTLVLPEQVTLSNAYEAFDDIGRLKSEKKYEQIQSLCQSIVSTIQKLK